MYRFLIFSLTLCLWGDLHAQTPALAAKNNQDISARAKFFRQSRGAKPSVTSGNIAVVNSASFLPGVSPGALVTIFGNNLSDVSGVVVAGTNPLPYELANVSVDVNGIAAPIFSVAYNGTEDQISVQVGTVQTDSFDEDPGIFTYQGSAVALLFPDYSLIGSGNAALPGDDIILYTTGLGPLSLNLQDGYGAPSNPLARTEDPFQVFVAGEACEVFFSGLAPGFVGLYQLNIRLPSDLPPGDLDIQIISPFASSNTSALPVN